MPKQIKIPTPAPWIDIKTATAIYIVEERLKNIGLADPICKITLLSAHDEANGRLIACAPDLLQAVKDVLTELDKLSATELLPFSKLYNNLQNQIQKATL